MSIDIDLVINTGHDEREVVYVGNYMHNCQAMWRLALRETGNDFGLCDIDGWDAEEAAQCLALAVAHMEDPSNRDRYLVLNPSNGWGDYEGALEFLRSLYTACLDNPLCTIRTSC